MIGPIETTNTSLWALPKFFIDLTCNQSNVNIGGRRCNSAINVSKFSKGDIWIRKHINDTLITILHNFRNHLAQLIGALPRFVDSSVPIIVNFHKNISSIEAVVERNRPNSCRRNMHAHRPRNRPRALQHKSA